jgi:hypothetical protein
MAAPAEQQSPLDEAAELEAAVRQAIEACGGDPVDAVRALIVMNSALDRELADVYGKASHGLLRGRRVAPAPASLPLTGAAGEPIPGSRRPGRE